MAIYAFVLWKISRRETGIINTAKRIRRVLSESVKETMLPAAAPIIPAITAKGTIFHSISRFLACITAEKRATGRKNKRFTHCASVWGTFMNNVSHIISINPPPSPMEAAMPVRNPIRTFILSSSSPLKSALLFRRYAASGCCLFFSEQQRR